MIGYVRLKTKYRGKLYFAKISNGRGEHISRRPFSTASAAIVYGEAVLRRYNQLRQKETDG